MFLDCSAMQTVCDVKRNIQVQYCALLKRI